MVESKKYPELRKQMTPGWWLSNRHYTAYMVRELTSFFILVFSLLYIYQVALLRTSPASYNNNYLGLLKSPGMVLFSIAALVFTLYHSFTWFYLTGKIQPIKIGKIRTTPLHALIVNTILLIIISFAVVQLLIVRG